MKSYLTVTIENDQFVINETRTVVQSDNVAKTASFAELKKIIETAGYKTAKFSDEAKIFKQSLAKSMKQQNDVKRQEREAKKAERVAAAKARVEARIAKLQERLGAFTVSA
jgi:chromosome segregation ATPase